MCKGSYVETIELPAVTGELLGAKIGTAGESRGVVGIYHTHNAESYVPSSGTESKDNGRGDILAVGKALASELEAMGLTVYWSDNSHIPHDAGLYTRRTTELAEELSTP